MLYSSAGIIAILVSLIINYDVLFSHGIIEGRERQYQVYKWYLLSTYAYYVTDLLWGIFNDQKLVQLTFIDTTLYFVFMALSVMMWTRFVDSYLEDTELSKIYLPFGKAFMCLMVVMLAVNVVKPVFFSIDAAGEYQAGIGRYIVIIIQIGLFLLTGAYALLTAMNNTGSRRISHLIIGSSSLIMACFIIAQSYLPLMPLYAIGSMLAGCMLHSFVLEREKAEFNQTLNKEKSEKAKLEKELESQSELAEILSSMSSLFTNLPAMTFSKDADTGVYLACNQAFAEYSGKGSPEEVIGKTDYDLYDKETADHFREVDKTTRSMEKPYLLLEEVPDHTGSIINLQTTKLLFHDSAGRNCILGMCVDVTESAKIKAEQAATEAREEEIQKSSLIEENYKKYVEELSYTATHDELTGLYNRQGYKHILQTLDLSRCYFIMLDADDFKSVNDTYGHETGDKVLIKIANTLKDHFRSGDYIFRVGGDEFIVVMTHAGENLKELVSGKLESINRDLTDSSDGVPSVSISAGVAHGRSAEDDTELLRRADSAMYGAKKRGKCAYGFA